MLKIIVSASTASYASDARAAMELAILNARIGFATGESASAVFSLGYTYIGAAEANLIMYLWPIMIVGFDAIIRIFRLRLRHFVVRCAVAFSSRPRTIELEALDRLRLDRDRRTDVANRYTAQFVHRISMSRMKRHAGVRARAGMHAVGNLRHLGADSTKACTRHKMDVLRN